MTTEIDRAMAAIVGPLPRDPHLATCPLAVASGPDATLACAYCRRAKWMHGTRHDTCERFRWITEEQLTDDKIMAVSHLPSGLTVQQRALCSVALNHFGAVPRATVDRSRSAVAQILNDACQRLPAAISGGGAVINDKQNIPVIRDPSCAGCGHPVDYEFGREPVSNGRTLWHFKCYLSAPDPERPTTNYTLVAARDAAMEPAIDRPRMIRWLEGRIRGWEELEASATSNRLRKQNAWQLLHARAVLAVLRGLPC